MDVKNLEKITNKIAQFDCKLLPVVKNQNIKSIQQLIDFGIKDLAENRLDELDLHKQYFPDIRFHFIAPLQSRKIPDVITKCNSIHSVSRKKELNIIANYYTGEDIFIQVNIDKDPNKNGIEKNKLMDFIKYSESIGIQPIGLMSIPNIESDRKVVFSEMQKINDELKVEFKNYPGELSMGMSNDYEIALDFGATIVRIGSKIFL